MSTYKPKVAPPTKHFHYVGEFRIRPLGRGIILYDIGESTYLYDMVRQALIGGKNTGIAHAELKIDLLD